VGRQLQPDVAGQPASCRARRCSRRSARRAQRPRGQHDRGGAGRGFARRVFRRDGAATAVAVRAGSDLMAVVASWSGAGLTDGTVIDDTTAGTGDTPWSSVTSNGNPFTVSLSGLHGPRIQVDQA